MKRIISLALALVLILTLTACDAYTGDFSDDSSVVPSGTNRELSKNWKDFTFELDGYVYQLPCAYQEFLDNGFTLQVAFSGTAELESNYCTALVTEKGKGLHSVSFTGEIVNFSDETKMNEDCDLYFISLTAADFPDLKLANGILIQSTVEEFQTALGTPTELKNYRSHSILIYKIDDHSYMEISVYSDTSNNAVRLCNLKAQ